MPNFRRGRGRLDEDEDPEEKAASTDTSDDERDGIAVGGRGRLNEEGGSSSRRGSGTPTPIKRRTTPLDDLSLTPRSSKPVISDPKPKRKTSRFRSPDDDTTFYDECEPEDGHRTRPDPREDKRRKTCGPRGSYKKSCEGCFEPLLPSEKRFGTQAMHYQCGKNTRKCNEGLIKTGDKKLKSTFNDLKQNNPDKHKELQIQMAEGTLCTNDLVKAVEALSRVTELDYVRGDYLLPEDEWCQEMATRKGGKAVNYVRKFRSLYQTEGEDINDVAHCPIPKRIERNRHDKMVHAKGVQGEPGKVCTKKAIAEVAGDDCLRGFAKFSRELKPSRAVGNRDDSKRRRKSPSPSVDGSDEDSEVSVAPSRARGSIQRDSDDDSVDRRRQLRVPSRGRPTEVVGSGKRAWSPPPEVDRRL